MLKSDRHIRHYHIILRPSEASLGMAGTPWIAKTFAVVGVILIIPGRMAAAADEGSCPPPDGTACGIIFCLSDSNCPQGQICCLTCSADIPSVGSSCVEPVDTTPPTCVNLPASTNLTLEFGTQGTTVNWIEPTCDDASGTTVINGSHTPPSFFTTGETNVTYICTDAAGNSVSCSFTVLVDAVDTTPPTCVNLPASTNLTLEFGTQGTTVNWIEPTCDDASGITVINGSHTPPSFFTIGETNVTYICTDAAGNSVSCSFTVLVDAVDTTPPTCVNLPDLIIGQVEHGTPNTTVGWTGPTCDDSSGTAAVTQRSHTPFSVFPVGITKVFYTCEDASGNNKTCAFTVNVTEGASTNEVLQNRLMNVADILSLGNATTEATEEAAEIVEEAAANEEFLAEDPVNVEVVIDTLELITNAEDTSVTEPVIRIVNNLMGVDAEVLTENTKEGGRVVAALEEQISNVQANEGNFTAVLDNVGVTAVKVDKENLGKSLAFANVFPVDSTPTIEGDLQENNTRLFADGDEIPGNQTATEITVPTTILDLIDGVMAKTEVPASFFIYGNSILFTPSRPALNRTDLDIDSNATFEERIVSQVISATLQDDVEAVQGLLSNITVTTKFITYTVLGKDEDVVAQECVHWSYNGTTGKGFWSTDGCTRSVDDRNRTVCSCQRLASFAVLVRVRKGSQKDAEALYFITLIGSTISGICLCLSLVTFLVLRSYRSKQPAHIHINLCVSLLGFYLVFLLSPLATKDETRCAVASAVTHFFCLATVAWMSAEAVNLYFLFVKMQRTGVRYFIPVACLLAYGIPTVCAVLVAMLDRDSNFLNADYCFIHPGPALYFGFLIEVAILFVVNFTIFIWILKKALLRPLMVSKTRENARRDEIIKRVRHGILFWFMLGLSWLFGVLAIVDTNTLLFDYLYCICISLQGFALFLLLCAANPEFRSIFKCKKAGREHTSRSTVGSSFHSTSVTKTTATSQSELPYGDTKDSNF